MTKIVLLTIILAVASVSCGELENICSTDTFRYKGAIQRFVVNAFHRVQRNVTFEPLSHYLINDTVKCDFAEFENKQNFWQTLKIKHEYNRKFAQFYTGDLSKFTAQDFADKRLEIYRVGEEPLTQMRYAEFKAECVVAFEAQAHLGNRVFEMLGDMIRGWHPVDHREPLFKPNTWEQIGSLRELVDQLEIAADDGTFAFQYHDGWHVYHHMQIVYPREFRLLSEGLDRVRPGSKLMLLYDQLLPFTNSKHNDRNCVKTENLPLFYKNKGIPVYDD